MGLVFTVAGLGKLLRPGETFQLFSFPDYLPAALSRVVFIWLPYLELIVGLLLIIGVATKLVTSFATVLIAGFIANNVWLLTQGLGDKPCGCFGMAERIAQARLSVLGSLYIDIIMLALVLVIFFYSQSRFFNVHSWFLRGGKVA